MANCKTRGDAAQRVLQARTGSLVGATLEYVEELERLVATWAEDLKEIRARQLAHHIEQYRSNRL